MQPSPLGKVPEGRIGRGWYERECGKDACVVKGTRGVLPAAVILRGRKRRMCDSRMWNKR